MNPDTVDRDLRSSQAPLRDAPDNIDTGVRLIDMAMAPELRVVRLWLAFIFVFVFACAVGIWFLCWMLMRAFFSLVVQGGNALPIP